MGNTNSRILLALVILTMGSYFFSESSSETWRVGFLILFAVFKVSLVVVYFMELKKAHLAWSMIFGLVLIVYTVFIFALYLP